ncbi:MAG: protein-tyrosine-phosphatase [Flavobacteriales bacterium]|nr:protein-tyrosine-phosphatase [Flavobacteriales bacterium]
MLRDIHIYVLSLVSEFKTIPSARRKELEEVATYIKDKIAKGETVNLIFICTHNSRRSQFGQVWAATAAAYYGVRNVNIFSGGTEETAFNKRAVDAIKRVGFKVDGTVSTNPRYSVRFSDETGALDCFSKTFDHAANPQKGFAAIMTCSDADENCPIILGAEYRARITYEDPKISDLTESEIATYDERCAQIATEMLYLFSKV